jgi:diguanylate cyclase (GGDEF)-like protein/PAS domain S-box-containing protein
MVDAPGAGQDESAPAARYARTLIEASLDPLVAIRSDGTIVDVNRAAESVTGVPRSALIGSDFARYLTDPDEARVAFRRAAHVRVENHPLTIRHVSGAVTDVLCSATVYTAENGDVAGLVVAAHDVTHLRRVERELAAQKERLELVLDASRLGLWDWNMQTDQAILDDDWWAEVLGYRLADLAPITSLTWTRLTHPDDRAAEELMTERHLRGETSDYDVELRMLHQGGHWVWIRDRGRVVEWSADGRPIRMAGTVEDISEAVRVREEAQQVAIRLRATLDSLLDPDIYFQAVRDDDGRIVDFVYADANEAACAYNKRTREQLIGARLLDVLPGHRTAGLIDEYAKVVDTGIPYIVDGQPYHNEILGREVRADVRGIRVGDGLNLTWREVTERYEIAEALATSEERYRLLAENITDVVGHVRQGRFVWVSSSVSGTLGWLMSDLIGQPYADFVHPEDSERVAAGGVRMEAGRTTRGRYRLRAKDGAYHWIDSRGGPFSNSSGTQDGFVVSVRVIDAEVQALETLEVRARLDELTGLPNRAEAFERLGLMLGQSVRTGALIAVVFCDFDRFKQVNDTFGHAVGDALLRIVADRFRSAVRVGDLVARIGGDELLVVLDGVHDLQDAKDIAEKLRRVVRTRVEVPGGVVNATMSFGITLAAQGETLDDVIARADLAMYEAKHAGRDHVASIPAN